VRDGGRAGRLCRDGSAPPHELRMRVASRAIRLRTRKDRSSRPRRGELPGVELDRPARRGPLLMRPREEVQTIRQLDRAVLACEDHPRAIRIVLGDREAVLLHARPTTAHADAKRRRGRSSACAAGERGRAHRGDGQAGSTIPTDATRRSELTAVICSTNTRVERPPTSITGRNERAGAEVDVGATSTVLSASSSSA